MSFFVFEFFFAITKIDIALDEVVVENFLFDEVFAVVVFEYFFEFVFFVGVGIEEGIGFKYFDGVFFVFFAIAFSFAAGGEDFIEEVRNGADNIGFAEVSAGDMDRFFKYF